MLLDKASYLNPIQDSVYLRAVYLLIYELIEFHNLKYTFDYKGLYDN